MFFFAGGISPRTLVRQTGLSCSYCGAQLSEVTVDHVLSLFFIPLWTVSHGKPLLACARCGWHQGVADALRQGGATATASASEPPTWPREEPSAPQLPHAESLSSARQGQGAAGRSPSACSGCGRGVSDPSYLFCPFCGTFLKDS